MAASQDQTPGSYHAGPTERPFGIEFHVTVVEGADGERLARQQAEAILHVLTWLHDHTTSGSAEPNE